MNGGTISGNTAENSQGGGGCQGGGVFLGHGGNFTMNGGTISGNTASGNSLGSAAGKGGGVYMAGSTNVGFAMYGGSITGNRALGFDIAGNDGGGGVFIGGGIFIMTGGTITGNSVPHTYRGGGVHYYNTTAGNTVSLPADGDVQTRISGNINNGTQPFSDFYNNGHQGSTTVGVVGWNLTSLAFTNGW
jgi:hypothetical protein